MYYLKNLLNVFTKTEREFVMKRIRPTFWCIPVLVPLASKHTTRTPSGDCEYLPLRACVPDVRHDLSALLKA